MHCRKCFWCATTHAISKSCSPERFSFSTSGKFWIIISINPVQWLEKSGIAMTQWKLKKKKYRLKIKIPLKASPSWSCIFPPAWLWDRINSDHKWKGEWKTSKFKALQALRRKCRMIWQHFSYYVKKTRGNI